MSITGSATTDKVLRGRVNRLDTLCISAYAIAVKHGFEGTEEEWLASLHCTDEQIAAAVAAYMEANQTSSAIIGEVTLKADNWVGTVSPYHQSVEIDGVTENSQVDLTPSVEQLAIFHNKDLAFVTENVDGNVTVYALGDKPTNDYTLQVTITEVFV